MVRLSIPADLERAPNPFATNVDAWRAAVDHYSDHCALCHGADGHGQTDLGENMYPKVPDLADPDVQRFSDGALFAIIQNGVRWTGMPAWKREHMPDDTWKLVSFVRRVPSLTSEEVQLLQHGRGAQHSERARDQETGGGHEHHHDVQPEHQHSDVRR
jgi:mono/diheme cytochrome c family protein